MRATLGFTLYVSISATNSTSSLRGGRMLAGEPSWVWNILNLGDMTPVNLSGVEIALAELCKPSQSGFNDCMKEVNPEVYVTELAAENKRCGSQGCGANEFCSLALAGNGALYVSTNETYCRPDECYNSLDGWRCDGETVTECRGYKTIWRGRRFQVNLNKSCEGFCTGKPDGEYCHEYLVDNTRGAHVVQCKNQVMTESTKCQHQRCDATTNLAKCNDWCADQSDGWNCGPERLLGIDGWDDRYVASHVEKTRPTLCRAGKTLEVKRCTYPNWSCTAFHYRLNGEEQLSAQCYNPCRTVTKAFVDATPPEFLDSSGYPWVCDTSESRMVLCKYETIFRWTSEQERTIAELYQTPIKQKPSNCTCDGLSC